MALIRFFVFSLLLGGVFGCSMPSQETTQVDPEVLLLEISDERRFLSVDQVADRIINDDPSLLLVDVRPSAQFAEFTLPTAQNIPLDEVLGAEADQLLDCSKYEVVFFSNGTVRSERAWMLRRREGCENIYIMAGGLNDWADKILSPEEPPQTASTAEVELYQFRKGACQYFIGASEAMEPEPYVQPVVNPPTPKKEIPLKPKKKVVEEEEGC